MPRIIRLITAAIAVAAPLSGMAGTRSLDRQIAEAARHAYLDPKLVEAVVKVESNFSPRATSPKGAKGLMQVTPQTADECDIPNAYHALSNLMGACDCLRKLINRYQGDLRLALAAYNAGPRRVDRYNGIPPFRETREYVRKVLALYHRLKSKP
jgi:soluble lytic murein transglycosylase-like protein